MRRILEHAAAAMLLLTGACGGDDATPAEAVPEPAAEAEEAQPGPAGSPAEEAGPVVEDPSFELRAEAGGPYTTGEAGDFQIRLTPRGNYHVNQEYPMSIEVRAPDAVELPSPTLARTDAETYEEQLASFKVPFVPGQAGTHRVTADVDFAVCTPETCVPERRTLALVLPVN